MIIRKMNITFTINQGVQKVMMIGSCTFVSFYPEFCSITIIVKFFLLFPQFKIICILN